MLTLSGGALAQTSSQSPSPVRAYTVPAGNLAQALNRFAEISQLQLIYSGATTRGLQTGGLAGSFTPQQALAQLLAGSGLSYRFTSAGVVTISGPGGPDGAPPPADGSLLLDIIDVNGAGGQSSVYTPYETAAATNFISGQDIERYRGSSPSDIFRGTPGVLSGDSRNSAGGIDVNIRGLQGQGRVRVAVDDAENAVTVYHGYQGQSNRTYIDPDLIAGIDINKGLDVASRGAAGSVNMRTIGAGDIVKPGDTWGVRVIGGFGTNTTPPTPGAIGGYQWPTTDRPGLTESTTGLDRPGFLSPTSGSGSVAAAVKQDNWDFLIAYAARKQGNYFAGKNGGNGVYASPVLNAQGIYVNSGYTNYRPGEEVLNTQLETESLLAKVNLRSDDGQSLQVTYNNYRGEGGYWLPVFGAMADMSQAKYGATTGTRIDTGTARYRWNPDDNDLIDVKVNAWLTYFQLLNQGRLVSTPGAPVGQNLWPADIGLADDFRTGTNTVMWGTDVSNTSKFAFDQIGAFEMTYGLSLLEQQVGLNRYAEYMSFVTPSSGTRDEWGAFAKAAYKPTDWLTLNAGLRYSAFSAEGSTQKIFGTTAAGSQPIYSGPPGDAGGFSPSAGIVVEPFQGTQFYANYSSALRLPSLMETVGVFTIIEPGLQPERLNSWDLGVNVTRQGVLAANDSAWLKFGWFDWQVRDYISRATQDVAQGTALRIHNIYGASFSGFELSSRYEWNGFAADFSANYYTKVEYCVTADTCGNMSLYGDYATNYVPPEYMLDLKLSQKFLDDKLTVGGRAYYVGPRAADHGDVTSRGYSAFITQIQWNPYALFDVFAEYKLNDNWTASARVENVTDQFYVDPLGMLPQPGPGRTFYASLTGKFGGDQPLPQRSRPAWASTGEGHGATDWSGFYAGANGGFAMARTQGASSVLNPAADTFGGLADGIAASEAANLEFSGGLVGLQAGYNWQFANKFVLGIEADFGKSWAEGRQDNRAVDDAVLAASNWLQSRTHHKVDWITTVRGRVGYAFDNGLMLYGTAGVALLREDVARDQYWVYARGHDQPGGNLNYVHYVDEDGATRIGATMGFGGEYALNDRWSLKSDYTYSRFGSTDYEFGNATAGAGPEYLTREIVGYTPTELPIYRDTLHEGASGIVNGRKASNTFDLHAIRLGLNYRF
ncbi:TonB-dependent receptor [Azorhizobium oxalatiphilum]|uniref:TonB-dependent receptor n=2 Tax=Azorhizobium oxalatiphilum TaxID=980631 RepID=A0A917FC36_9HYPH|nr:TonB-dependent receptor [Azorhizobium oxalatiphilum]